MNQEASSRLGFALNRLNRLAERREDAAAMQALREDPAARAFVLDGDIPLLRRSLATCEPLFGLAEAANLGVIRETVFLGVEGVRPLFAIAPDATGAQADPDMEDIVRIDLRSVAIQGLLPPERLGPLAQAKSLLTWHRHHGFCANCGQPTRSVAAGWRRRCGSCASDHFPRTDAVVIMLAIKDGRCVLGRQPRFPQGVYSCLAGFLEPGETLENAVRRELFEEAGIETAEVTYWGSQPWPFGSSLMIGCLARVLGDELTADPHELEDARWFERAEVAAMLSGAHPDGLICPPPIAIGHSLLRAFAEGQCGM